MCEEIFGGEIEIEKEPGEIRKSEAKLHKESMKKTYQNLLKHITRVEAAVKGMVTFEVGGKLGRFIRVPSMNSDW